MPGHGRYCYQDDVLTSHYASAWIHRHLLLGQCNSAVANTVSAYKADLIEVEMLIYLCRYEVKFQNGQECGGAYLKLLTADDELDLVSQIN